MVGAERLARPAHWSISSIDEVAEFVGRQLAEPRLAGADHGVGELALVVDERVDALLDGALAHQLVDEHGALLADAPRPVGGLVLHRRVPPAVVVDHLAGSGEVEPGAAGLQRHEQQRRRRRRPGTASTIRSRPVLDTPPCRNGGVEAEPLVRGGCCSSSPISRNWVNTSARSPASSRSVTSSSKRVQLARPAGEA